MPKMNEHPEYIVKSVSYAFEILEVLAEYQTGLSLMQLADRFELDSQQSVPPHVDSL